MVYEIGNLTKKGKYGMGQKNCSSSPPNEFMIYMKNQNLTSTFNPYL